MSQAEMDAGNSEEAGYWKTDAAACDGVLAGLSTLERRHNMDAGQVQLE